MDEIDFNPAVTLAIQFIFTILFGTAAWDKIKGTVAPDWFLKSFEPTVISKLPGGAKAAFWMIAALESAFAVAFPLSVAMPMILPFALVGALFFFGALCFGLRITGDFQGSANMFIYFAVTLLGMSLFT